MPSPPPSQSSHSPLPWEKKRKKNSWTILEADSMHEMKFYWYWTWTGHKSSTPHNASAPNKQIHKKKYPESKEILRELLANDDEDDE